MKSIDEYMKMPYRTEIVPDAEEGGYGISIPELPGCISCGETVESAVANIEAAKREWINAAIEDGIEIPEPDRLNDYSGEFKLRIPKSLHRQLALQSAREGISMNQYCVYLLSRGSVQHG